MKNKDKKLFEIKVLLEKKFPDLKFSIFDNKYIGCDNFLDMIITNDIFRPQIFCYGEGAKILKLECYHIGYETENAEEIYDEVLECLKNI